MTTTASRSRDYMRKLGYTAECVEHRRGKFIRVDLFGVADVLAFKDGEIILIQAFHKKELENHKHINEEHPMVRQWLKAGGLFEFHLWNFKTKNKRKYWSVERHPLLIGKVWT